jgi:hypothetical protein
MWLLDTATISLHLILSTPIPPYAILSHTWGTSEVTLQDLQAIPPKNQDSAGYKKILFSCAQARFDGFKYIWIDTCCIDKTNSAKLSEAINSMFEWYSHRQLILGHFQNPTQNRHFAYFPFKYYNIYNAYIILTIYIYIKKYQIKLFYNLI